MKNQSYKFKAWKEFSNVADFLSYVSMKSNLIKMFEAAILFLRDECEHPWLVAKIITKVELFGNWEHKVAMDIYKGNPSESVISLVVVTADVENGPTERKIMEVPSCILWDWDLFKVIARAKTMLLVREYQKQEEFKRNQEYERSLKLCKVAEFMTKEGFSEQTIKWAMAGLKARKDMLKRDGLEVDSIEYSDTENQGGKHQDNEK